jgi:Protein of unknown function (DUF2950)
MKSAPMIGTSAMRTVARLGSVAAVAVMLSATPGWSQGAERLFPTPEEAVAALVQAVQNGDRPTVAAIVGPEFAELIEGQGAEANAADRERFLEAARRATVLRPDGDDRRTLEVGLEAWPLPAPLVREAGGWRFDGAEGVEAVKDRIVGRNELEAIRVLRAYVDAQVAYASEDRDGDAVLAYAQRLASTPGAHDGLYWPVAGAEEPSPFGPFLAAAGVQPESRDPVTPYYGYFFRIMTRQGDNAPGGAYDYIINGNMIAGFAMVAWPAIYGESGVMTFVVNQSGTVLERDMGSETDEIGPKMLTYNPDAGWLPVEE